MPTNGMTINDLNTVSALTAQDKVPVWDNESSGEPTRKITAQNMANSVKTLGNLVNTTEMNDAIEQSMAPENGQYYGTVANTGAKLMVVIPFNRRILANYNVAATDINVINGGLYTAAATAIWEGCAVITWPATDFASAFEGKSALVNLTFTPKS